MKYPNKKDGEWSENKTLHINFHCDNYGSDVIAFWEELYEKAIDIGGKNAITIGAGKITDEQKDKTGDSGNQTD